jgi:hypothetical protein
MENRDIGIRCYLPPDNRPLTGGVHPWIQGPDEGTNSKFPSRKDFGDDDNIVEADLMMMSAGGRSIIKGGIQ